MHAGFDATSPTMVPTNVSTAQREKRRFYIKKTIIGMQDFREWEEKLGDAWYRHHHKVNNIVYYHCKYEPCYASMKAKVMVDCVQLYATEEGHTHPAPADLMSVPARNPQIMESITRDGVAFGQKRKADEHYYGNFSSQYPQQFLNEILRIQGDFNNVHETNPTSCGYINQPGTFQNIDAPKEGVEVKVENQNGSATDMRMEIITSVSAAVDAASRYAPNNMQQQMENGGTAKKLPDGCEEMRRSSKPNTAHTNASPVSSPECHAQNPTTSAGEKNDVVSSDESESDNDLSDSESDDAKCSSSHADQKSAQNNADTGLDASNNNNDLFALLKAKIEAQPPWKRMRYLRRTRRQLSYFLQMHALKMLSAKVPPTVKYEDIFRTNPP